MTTKVSALLGGAALVAMTIGTASAASVSDTLFTGFQQLSDNSAEYLINGANSVGVNTVDVGDRLRGIFTIETVEKSPFPTRFLGTGGNDELTGIFDLVVVAKSGGPGAYQFTFAPSGALAAYGGANVGAAFFADSTPDYTRVRQTGCVDIACMEARATDGSLFWAVGFTSPNNFWMATAFSDDITTIGSIPAPGNGGQFNAGVNLIANPAATGPALGLVQCFNPLLGVNVMVSMCGSGSLLGTGGVDTPFQSFDDVNFTINRIPEPATLGLMGLGLLGVAVAGRRRKG